MQYKHLCISHALQIQFNEAQALEIWDGFMRQGIASYAHCQWNCSVNYLSAALEVASLRAETCKNQQFTGLHLLKPFEFILDIFISQKEFTQALTLIKKVRVLIESQEVSAEKPLQALLQRYTQKLIEAVQDDFDLSPQGDDQQGILMQGLLIQCQALLASRLLVNVNPAVANYH